MDEQLKLGQQLLEAVDELLPRLGAKTCQKLKRRISAELTFLEELKRRVLAGEMEPSCDLPASLNSSNLPFLRGVVDVAKASGDVLDVLTNFRAHCVSIDVICDGGRTWVKVIARNPQSLHLVWAGKGQYGDRDLLQKAARYVAAARKYRPVHPPRLVFHFCSAVTHEMAAHLEALGISVVGSRVDVAEDVCRRLEMSALDDSSPSQSSTDSDDGSDDNGPWSNCGDVDSNADLSTHRQASSAAAVHWDHIESAAVCQASAARPSAEPPAASISAGLQATSGSDGRSLPCRASGADGGGCEPCATGYDGAIMPSGRDPVSLVTSSFARPSLFLDITALIALASELTHGGCYYVFREQVLTEQAVDERINPALPLMERHMIGKELVTCRTALEDFLKLISLVGGPRETARAHSLLESVTVVNDCKSERTASLRVSSRIKKRSKVIFGTADALGYDILTANSGFVRAAAGQGVNYSAFLHPSRALTEKKEKNSTRIPSAPLPPEQPVASEHPTTAGVV